MYQSICEEMRNVEEALSDVRDMIRDSHQGRSKPNEEHEAWQYEWYRTVQQIATTNSGWAWQGFWGMVERNLYKPACVVRNLL